MQVVMNNNRLLLFSLPPFFFPPKKATLQAKMLARISIEDVARLFYKEAMCSNDMPAGGELKIQVIYFVIGGL